MDSVLKDLVIVKRSGQRVSFNGIKIAVAIKKAFDNVYENPSIEKINFIYSEVLKYINDNYKDRKTINVEDIQDIIENTLKNKGFTDVYNAFSDYRNKRKMSRDYFDKKSEHKFVKATEKIILDTQENTSVCEMLFKYGKTISEEYSKAYLIDNKYLRSHNEGEIYIHNLDNYLLATLGNTFVDLSCLNNYDTYFEDMASLLLNIKYEASEISIASFDYLLENYVLYNFKKIFIKNILFAFDIYGISEYINTMSLKNVINKLNSIELDLNDYDKFLYNDVVKNIFINTYDYSINELKDLLEKNISILLNTLNNNHNCIKSNIYSISIGTDKSFIGTFINNIYFKVINDLDRLNVVTIYKTNGSELDEIIRLIYSKKNIVINNINTSYNINLSNSTYTGECEYFSNGKRIKDNVFEKNTSLGRSIISSVAINLVRIAFKSKTVDDFYNNLDNELEFVKNELKDSFEYIASKNTYNYEYLFSNNILIESSKLEDNKKIRKVIKNGTFEISFVGIYECVKLLKGTFDIDFSLSIIKYMRDKCDLFTNELKLNFVLSEEIDKCVFDNFSSLDASIYGNVDGVTDKNYEYFTNHLDKDKYIIEAKIHKYLNGGYNEVINMKGRSMKQLKEEIKLMIDSDIGFIKVVI